MKATSPSSSQLQQLLQRELEMTSLLQEHLGRERSALTEQDLDGLMQVATSKQQCVLQLEEIARQRESLLQQMALPASRAGMEQLLEQLNDNTCHTLWDQLTTTAEMCREENRQLGMLIQRGQNTTRQAQHLLQRGTTASNHSYNATGHTEDQARTRSLAKA